MKKLALAKDQNQTILQRTAIFNKLFEGKKVKPSQMFSTITTYSPTGLKRKEPHNKQNQIKYNRFIVKERERRLKWELY